MAKIIDNRNQLDQTIRIFDSFYSLNMVVNTNQYDIVHGYFTGICDTKQIAENFTAIIFRIAQVTGIDALELLAEFKGTSNKLEMNKTLAYYLNGFKTKTSLYGVGVVPRPVLPVARNVVQ